MKYKIKKGLIFEKKGKKISIFDPEKSNIYYFNETAGLIFSKAKNGFDEKKIVDFLINKYEINKTQTKKEVKKFMKELVSKNIIVIS